MDKLMEEEDLKGLEEEIDNAVDRLFVERKRDGEESFSMESPIVDSPSKFSASEPSIMPPVFKSPVRPHSFDVESPLLETSITESALAEPPLRTPPVEPPGMPPALESPARPHPFEPPIPSPVLEASYEFEEDLAEERPLHPSSPPSSAAVPFLKSIEKMEAQLLSLEWEITGEKLEKTREEVLALKELFKQKADLTFILGCMESVLNHMIKNQEGIRPPWIKFLLDSKETIKLLMRKEAGAEINSYKQLAYLGIEARFSCLEGMRDVKISQPSSGAPMVSLPAENKIGEMEKSVHSLMERVEEIFGTIQQQIVKLEETSRKPPAPSLETRSLVNPAIHVTIFRIDERLFGVESEKVFKLFKVPNTFEEKCSDQRKIRLRNFEVKIIDLKKLLAIPEGGPKEQIRILTVKEDGEYKGFMIDEVLKRVSILSDRKREASGYFSGIVHITYQDQAVEIPILDLNRL
jgi:chemotaxis signal transduction protein